ncbi:hypothetical protein [Chryseobacterium pennipullorum]|uniref:Uncharacterized protein n=1 Tax=Chryseobacterium pennipullorum TaxID=2258963 RepID=A0A3D9B0X4_9FLAO|nr:hypothetical protein [Chryseobacterium pennipullorum]REC46988.1 hypothetical protein DRF67_12255 [Chryseobacterium pennipullorum]
MKLFLSLTLFAAGLIISCTKQQQQQPQSTSTGTFNTGDSMVSGSAQVTPDSGDNTLPMDSTAYDVDSIKNSK